jgi:integrase
LAVKEDDMQNGSLIWAERSRHGPVWEYRWREPGPDGTRKHRRIVVGPVSQFEKREDALRAISALQRDINHAGKRQWSTAITMRELFDHYRQRELLADNTSKTSSTKHAYEGYITKWISPRWGAFPLARIRAGEVEQWLRSLPLAPGSCAKIRNIMSVLFNHAIRHDLFDRNPIRWVRQSAKRMKTPRVLSVSELQSLLSALAVRERTLVLLDVCTGLRMSELFALKWEDVNFESRELDVRRSIVEQIVGSCKTEASQKPVPLDQRLADALLIWKSATEFNKPEDWLFASPVHHGRRPYWGQAIMRNVIQPRARDAGIALGFGWHSFRHTFSILLRANHADVKVMQELLRHASSRVTLETYTQAITAQKREAQSSVVNLICGT